MKPKNKKYTNQCNHPRCRQFGEYIMPDKSTLCEKHWQQHCKKIEENGN